MRLFLYELEQIGRFSNLHWCTFNNDKLIVWLEYCNSDLIWHYFDKGDSEYFHQLPNERNSTKRSIEICERSQLLKKMLLISPHRIQLVIFISFIVLLAKSKHFNGKDRFVSSEAVTGGVL